MQSKIKKILCYFITTKKVNDLKDKLDKLTRTIEENDKDLNEEKLIHSQLKNYVEEQIIYKLNKSRFKN